MRVLLINPFYPISETPSPPLGLAYLAGALLAAGVEVAVFDAVVHPYSPSALEELLHDFRPDVAGTTAVTMTVDHALQIIRDLKRLDPGLLTVIGGPHVTFCRDDTFRRCPELDIIVRGEGEHTLVDLVRAIETGRPLEEVPGLAFRKGDRIIATPDRPLITDLDSLPMPCRQVLPLGRYRALGMAVSMTTTRGCPHQCIFCVGRKMVGAKVRYRSPQSVADEMRQLAELKFPQINLADDLFTAKPSHCLAVCDEILRRKLSVTWTAFARVDTVSLEVLQRMHAAGCSAVSFGIESGNTAILRTIRKGITKEQVVAAVRMCREAGIIPFASFILGLPGETMETIHETLAFGEELKELGLLYGFHLLAPFPGTEVREAAGQFGLKILTDDWPQYHANRAVVETAGVTKQILDDIVIRWESEYNNLLADIRRRMQTAEAQPDEVRQWTNLERTVFIYDLMMNRVVEREGCWKCRGSNQGSDGQALRLLAERISRVTAYTPVEVGHHLTGAVERGDLVCQVTDGETQWKWKDCL
jgi:anaerobic magnesium-protoporphyrin IX monomethyl ester cyclase